MSFTPFRTLDRTQSISLLVMLLGLSVLVLGLRLSGDYKEALVAIGGAGFGAGFGALLAMMKQVDFGGEVLQFLKDSLHEPKISSDELRIERFRRQWHFYHVTRIEGERIWCHNCVDFSQTPAVGQLSAEMLLFDASADAEEDPSLLWFTQNRHKAIVYHAEAGLRNNTLMLSLVASVGSDKGVCVIFPNAGVQFGEPYCGLAYLEDWDQRECVGPAILSSNPIIQAGMGRINKVYWGELDGIWNRKMSKSIDREF